MWVFYRGFLLVVGWLTARSPTVIEGFILFILTSK